MDNNEKFYFLEAAKLLGVSAMYIGDEMFDCETSKPIEITKELLDAKSTVEKLQKEYEIRLERNRRLMISDWTQLPDAPVNKNAWALYRQALRDLPSTIKNVESTNIVWPTEPTAN